MKKDKMTKTPMKGEEIDYRKKEMTEAEDRRIQGVQKAGNLGAKEISEQIAKQKLPFPQLSAAARHAMNKRKRNPERSQALSDQRVKARRSDHLRDPRALEDQPKSKYDEIINEFGGGPSSRNNDPRDRIRSGAEKRKTKDPKPNPGFFHHERIDHLKGK